MPAMKVMSWGALAMAIALAACDSAKPAGVSPGLKSGTVAVDGGSLYYETLGKGAPVILIHGGFGDRRMWDEQFEPLSQAFRVIRYDHRGFGKSAPPAQAYSPVADLVKLMDHLDLKRANLVATPWAARWRSTSRCSTPIAPARSSSSRAPPVATRRPRKT